MAKFEFRKSRVLSKIRAGGIVTCAQLNLGNSRVAEIAARCGFDCVWLDMEHAPNTLKDVEGQILAAKMHNVDPMVRIRKRGYNDYILPFELDAAGIMIPHVMSGEEARKIVWDTRYHPVGRRPIDGGNSDGGYCMIPLLDYIKQSNEQRFIIIQIEDPEAVENLEQIAQVEGIDGLFFGANDFSHGLGIPGQYTDARVQKARELVAETAGKYGKFAACAGSVDNFGQLVDMGYQFIKVVADVYSIAKDFNATMETLNEKYLKGSC